MDKELKLITENHKLDLLYKNNLFSLKSICQLLGVWDNYSPEDQYKLENFTKRDSNINRHFDYNGSYNKNYTYGEIMRAGVDIIIEKINRYKKPTEKDVFVDIGSGAGKLVLHLAIKTNFQTLVGVEVVPHRNRYSKYIKENTLTEKSIFFIEKDILDFDLSIATVIFFNNLCFDQDFIINVYNRIPKGCHFISVFPIKSCKILKEEFEVDTSWGDKLKLYYYIK